MENIHNNYKDLGLIDETNEALQQILLNNHTNTSAADN